jgi:hypothetical protein
MMIYDKQKGMALKQECLMEVNDNFRGPWFGASWRFVDPRHIIKDCFFMPGE